jgi:hypothetical protein
MAATSPEIELIGAIMTHILVDLQSPVSQVREEARLFVACGGVRWWDEAMGMGGSLVRQRRQRMPRGCEG